MSFLNNIYKQSLEESDRNLNFWQDYLDSLNALDFNIFSDKLKVPILVPVGNKIFFRGNLIHTNEVTVSLGADYFAKCSIKQAEILRQHRIKGAKSKIDLYTKEREYLEKQLNFDKSTYEAPAHDIIETCTEEEDKLWREMHRERVRQYNQSAEKKKEESNSEITDDDLWARLEELELQEELEEEYLSMKQEVSHSDNSFILKHEDCIEVSQKLNPIEDDTEKGNVESCQTKTNLEETDDAKLSKIQLLKQVIDRQKNLESQIIELKNKERVTSNTEKDIYSKLDEIEQLEELEDELDRLDDIVTEDSDDTDTSEEISIPNSKKTVTFAVDEDESQTLELTFKHSDVEPNNASYNPNTGITKPSDIYEAFSNLFVDEATSILKKTKYDSSNIEETKDETLPQKELEESRQTIVIKDITENVVSDEKSHNQQRPISLFKKRRQQQKM